LSHHRATFTEMMIFLGSLVWVFAEMRGLANSLIAASVASRVAVHLAIEQAMLVSHVTWLRQEFGFHPPIKGEIAGNAVSDQCNSLVRIVEHGLRLCEV